jgi:hypothetical protein
MVGERHRPGAVLPAAAMVPAGDAGSVPPAEGAAPNENGPAPDAAAGVQEG